jgi:hypothetical protein
MPQLLVLAAIGIGAYMGTKWFSKKLKKFNANMEKANKAQRQKQTQDPSRPQRNDDVPELVKDPVTGVYQIKED